MIVAKRRVPSFFEGVLRKSEKASYKIITRFTLINIIAYSVADIVHIYLLNHV
jgi:hypothetical protein